MTVTINGSGSITEEITIDGVTVGQGAGNVATNTAVGASALDANTSGAYNVALGTDALGANTTASNNTAVGYHAGYSNTSSVASTFLGAYAGENSTGEYNTIVGSQAGRSLTTGANNTFIGARTGGFGAGYYVTTGAKNTILGGYNGNQGGLDIRTSSNNIVLSDGDGNPRLLINSSGSLLVGRTSQYYGEKLSISDTSTGKTVLFHNTNASFANDVLSIRGNRNTTNGTYSFIQCSRDNIADVMFVRDSGNLVNANNSYGGLSDIKLKENVVDATPKLEDLMRVQVRSYNLKYEPDRRQIGVIAQELEQVFPNMVEETQDKDEEGNNLGTTTKSVKYSVFIPMLIKAMQEQQSIIETLEARIAALEATP